MGGWGLRNQTLACHSIIHIFLFGEIYGNNLPVMRIGGLSNDESILVDPYQPHKRAIRQCPEINFIGLSSFIIPHIDTIHAFFWFTCNICLKAIINIIGNFADIM